MVLKILFLLAILYILYRIFGGKIELPKFRTKESSKDNDIKELEDNTLIECSSCSVYITKKEAIYKGKKYFCGDCMREK